MDGGRRILLDDKTREETVFTETGYSPYSDFKYTNFNDAIIVAGVDASTDSKEFANNELNNAIDKEDLTVDDNKKEKNAMKLSISLAAILLYILF